MFRNKCVNLIIAIMYAVWGAGLLIRYTPGASLIEFLDSLYPAIGRTIIAAAVISAFFMGAIYFALIKTKDPRFLIAGLWPFFFYGIGSIARFILVERTSGLALLVPWGLLGIFMIMIIHQAVNAKDDE